MSDVSFECVLSFPLLSTPVVTEFGVLSVAVSGGVRSGRPGWRLDWVPSTFRIALAFAAWDEWHQSFVPVRQAGARAAVIDILCAVLAQILVWAYANWRRAFTVSQSLPAKASGEK